MKIKQVILGITLVVVIGLSGLLVYLSQLSTPTSVEKQTKATETEEFESKIYDKNGKLVYSSEETNK
ncbi:hypothetical protein OL233_10400 [Vagococcus sp. PNs007]|uniref:Uncharacterized protein n=1 Tax=Vagococcus proximus TaxID=2991417 RepID=A0ABT5X3X9_9ENTE|nr:hypothetical protein [Vagococcus proximus]MDF0480690.1 hypothetical protein [Vagococcus proximus]